MSLEQALWTPEQVANHLKNIVPDNRPLKEAEQIEEYEG
jgi:hypothetical protein